MCLIQVFWCSANNSDICLCCCYCCCQKWCAIIFVSGMNLHIHWILFTTYPIFLLLLLSPDPYRVVFIVRRNTIVFLLFVAILSKNRRRLFFSLSIKTPQYNSSGNLKQKNGKQQQQSLVETTSHCAQFSTTTKSASVCQNSKSIDYLYFMCFHVFFPLVSLCVDFLPSYRRYTYIRSSFIPLPFV